MRERCYWRSKSPLWKTRSDRTQTNSESLWRILEKQKKQNLPASSIQKSQTPLQSQSSWNAPQDLPSCQTFQYLRLCNVHSKWRKNTLHPIIFLQAQLIMLRKKEQSEVRCRRNHFVPSRKKSSKGSLTVPSSWWADSLVDGSLEEILPSILT